MAALCLHRPVKNIVAMLPPTGMAARCPCNRTKWRESNQCQSTSGSDCCARLLCLQDKTRCPVGKNLLPESTGQRVSCQGSGAKGKLESTVSVSTFVDRMCQRLVRSMRIERLHSRDQSSTARGVFTQVQHETSVSMF